MSDLTRFLKQNKKEKKNAFYAVSKNFTDEKGNPLKWEIKPITTEENNRLRDQFTREVPVKGKPNMFRSVLDSDGYMQTLLVRSVVNPNLNSKELQDSYGISKPEELLMAMVDEPGEYDDFIKFVTGFNGFNVGLDDKVENAKN